MGKQYLELLKDPHWQKMRLKILERDNFACQICDGTKETLHVHHHYYIAGKKPWEYPATALITLCANCHAYERAEWAKGEKQLLLELKRAGFLAEELWALALVFCGTLPVANRLAEGTIDKIEAALMGSKPAKRRKKHG